MIWNLHGWVQRDLPATDRNGGESSLPDVPAGTGGTHECNRMTDHRQTDLRVCLSMVCHKLLFCYIRCRHH